MMTKETPGSFGGDTGQSNSIPQSSTFCFDSQSIFLNIVNALGGKIQSDGSAMVLCPAHDDKNPSLHITDTGGKILVHCMAGCTQDSVISALKNRGVWSNNKHETGLNGSLPAGIPAAWGMGSDSKPYVAHWTYLDINGVPIGHTVRYQRGVDKDVVPFFKEQSPVFGSVNQDIRWKAGAAPLPRPLYNLHLVGMATMSDHKPNPVLIPEGEKACDAAHNLVAAHYDCMTWPGGSKAANKADWTPLHGRDVVIWPDADEPGDKAALMVKEQCLKAGVKSCQIVTPPMDVIQGWDLADAKTEGWTMGKVIDYIKANTDGKEENQNLWEKPMDLLPLVDIQPEPIKWFTAKRIVAGRGLIITGVGGSSKTRLLYHLAVGAILGKLPWSWDVSTMGRVVLVLTEDTANDVHTILHNLSDSLFLSLEEKQTLYRSLIIYPLAGKDTILLSKTGAGTLEKSNLFLNLTEKIKGLGDVAFVGMDPALSLTDGDELDQSNQRALGKMADDLAVLTGAAVALVTHATKGSLQQETLGSHNSRGGGAITDAARTEFVMRTMTAKEFNKAGFSDPEEQFRHVQLVGTKGNYLPPSAYLPVWLRRDNYGMLSEANISFDKKTGPTERDISALSLLRDLSPKPDRSMGAWREACINSGVIKSKTEDAAKKTMKRIVKALKDSGMIRKGIGKGIWLPAYDEKGENN